VPFSLFATLEHMTNIVPSKKSTSAVSDNPPDAALSSWELLVIDAVGNVIEFWGYKRNQGRLWALLYLRDVTLTAAQLQQVLGLSKGAVSMITRELEGWNVVERVREPGSATWRFKANCDLPKMINRVLSERETVFLSSIRADLAAAERVAHADPKVSREVADRVTRMRRLAELLENTLATFLKTARLDLSGIVGVLQAVVRRPRRERRHT
jgi:DNA-binding transcriptional regulator GbsR (MarR family)